MYFNHEVSESRAGLCDHAMNQAVGVNGPSMSICARHSSESTVLHCLKKIIALTLLVMPVELRVCQPQKRKMQEIEGAHEKLIILAWLHRAILGEVLHDFYGSVEFLLVAHRGRKERMLSLCIKSRATSSVAATAMGDETQIR